MKHQDILDMMTVEEKAALLSGASEWTSRGCERLGIPEITFSDGPHGLRRQEGAGDHLGLNASLPATCFPTAATVANSWDVKLGEEVGRALGEEALLQGVDVLLGPGLNIKRSPLCGRNFEYFSEDPYLSGKMAAGYVRGVQSKGVRSCIKHFAVNSQEERRMAMNAIVDERTLREIYLTGFEIAVKEGGAKSLMTSYNEVNGTYANENKHLLMDILRGEWGFDGLVVTDWGASNDHVAAVKCRSDVEMPKPGLESARELLEALKSGRLTKEELDACVDDVLDAALEAKKRKKSFAEAQGRQKAFREEDGRLESAMALQDGQGRPAGNSPDSIQESNLHDGDEDGAVYEAWKEDHHKLASKAARESIVLLKNEGGLLPLKKDCKVALVGDFAKVPRHQGAGSSMVNSTALESMEDLIGAYPVNCLGCAQGYRRDKEEDTALKKEALELAKQAEVVLYCFGLDEMSESEGIDRSHMRIPQNQIDLLAELSRVSSNVVGILSAGSAVEMPWHGSVRALLHGYLGGQAGAGAMLDVLTGAYNPSGKLAETYPVKYEDTPAYGYYPALERSSQYREGIYVGYRYYETADVKVRYPFGYGLSYTEFGYEGLEVQEDGIWLTVTNLGKMDGAEIVQMYVKGPKGHIFRPALELKGFAKVFVPAGEKKRVWIGFDDKTFRYWNEPTGRFEVEEGTYEILVGASVKDIRLTGKIKKDGTVSVYPYEEKLPSYESGKIKKVPDEEYEKLLGYLPPEKEWKGELTDNDALCQMYYAKSRLARWVCGLLTAQKKKNEEQGKLDLNILFIYNMPFRAIAKMTHGAVSMKMVDGMVQAVNGQFFRGLWKIIYGYFENRSADKKYEKRLNG